MPIHAVHKGTRAAGIVKVIHLPFHCVQFLAQGLNLIPGICLRRLHLTQLHIVLLHLLFKAEAAPTGAAAGYAGAQRRRAAQASVTRYNVRNVRIISSFFKFALFPGLFYAR